MEQLQGPVAQDLTDILSLNLGLNATQSHLHGHHSEWVRLILPAPLHNHTKEKIHIALRAGRKVKPNPPIRSLNYPSRYILLATSQAHDGLPQILRLFPTFLTFPAQLPRDLIPALVFNRLTLRRSTRRNCRRSTS